MTCCPHAMPPPSSSSSFIMPNSAKQLICAKKHKIMHNVCGIDNYMEQSTWCICCTHLNLCDINDTNNYNNNNKSHILFHSQLSVLAEHMYDILTSKLVLRQKFEPKVKHQSTTVSTTSCSIMHQQSV